MNKPLTRIGDAQRAQAEAHSSLADATRSGLGSRINSLFLKFKEVVYRHAQRAGKF